MKIYLTRRLLHLRKSHVHLLYLENIAEHSKSRNTRFNLEKIKQQLRSFKNQVSSLIKLQGVPKTSINLSTSQCPSTTKKEENSLLLF